MTEDATLRRSVWISSLITLVGLALFIGITALIPQMGSGVGRILLGLFLSLVPAAVWMAFFYQQDRAEPEPKRLIVRMYAFGALAAAAVAVPFASRLAAPAIAASPSLVVRIILTILSISLMQEALKIAMVRYVVLGTREFDTHPDGIVYGMASGLGFATILNIAFVLQSGGVIPLAAAIRAVDNTLIHSVLGAVGGYYIGRVKIDGKKLGWMVQGLVVVTFVNGLYQVASDEVSRRLAFNPWYSLAVALVLTVVVGLVLFAFFRRAQKRAVGDLQTISIQAHARSKDMPWDIRVRYDWLLIGAAAVALVVAVVTGIVQDARVVAYTGSSPAIRFRYPGGWAVQSPEGSSFIASNLSETGLFKPTIQIVEDKTRGTAALDLLVTEQVAADEAQKALYTEIARTTELEIDGYPSVRSEYQYAATAGGSPIVIHGITTYVLVDTRLYTFTYEAETEDFGAHLERYERLLRSVSFEGGQ
jgi:RsiW-degrading membrane proteinase PrsW (M82 family)